MREMEWNPDYESGILFVGVHVDSPLIKYFRKDEPFEGIANRYGLSVLEVCGDEAGYFNVPRGKERELRDKLLKDDLVNNVEYVVEGVYGLLELLDTKGVRGDLNHDILCCTTKEEINMVLEGWSEEIKELRL